MLTAILIALNIFSVHQFIQLSIEKGKYPLHVQNKSSVNELYVAGFFSD